MAIRVSAMSVPAFTHGKRVRKERVVERDGRDVVEKYIEADILEVGSSWTVLDKPGPNARAALRDFHGRFVRVHPEDRTRLSELQLRYVDEFSPLVDLELEAAAKVKSDARAKAKADAKAAEAK